jgi:hypothetical protein
LSPWRKIVLEFHVDVAINQPPPDEGAAQPWFLKVGNAHGHGNLTDGSISDLKIVLRK